MHGKEQGGQTGRDRSTAEAFLLTITLAWQLCIVTTGSILSESPFTCICQAKEFPISIHLLKARTCHEAHAAA